MDEVWLKRTKQWLLEHAIKHDMDDVIKYILKDSNIFGNFYQVASKPDIHSSSQPTLIFLLLLKYFQKFLLKSPKNKISEILYWDEEALSVIIEILDAKFQQTSFLPFEVFLKLMKILKLMEILRMLYEGVNSRTIVQKLNAHFPRWNSKYKESLHQTYKNESEFSLEKIRNCNTDCRRFILKLTVNDSLRTNYISASYEKDLKQLISKSIPLLNKVVNIVGKLIGLSAVEQFVSSADEDFSSSDDPAVQILLEYLKPGMNQEDFLELLQVLEPGAEIPPDNFVSLCLGSPSGFSEESFFQNTEDCYSQGEKEASFMLSMNEGVTPVHSQKANQTNHKFYDYLGLYPPSSKKKKHIKEPDIVEMQEDIELILDSDDED